MGHADAVLATRAWTRRSYNSSTWEHLIVGTSRATSRSSCLVSRLGIECPSHRRAEVGSLAAAALRRGFPDLTDSPSAWRSKHWDDAEIHEIVAIVGAVALRVVAAPAVPLPATRPSARSAVEAAPGPHGFVPWRPFAERSGVPDAEGVYLIGLGTELAGTHADPMAERVIYIGMTERRGLRTRLDEFENGAISCSTHSAGWHYRTEVYPDDWASLSAFRDTHVAWRETPGDARHLEDSLRRAYTNRWGRRPRLNRV